MEKAHNFTTTDIFAEHLTLTFSLDNDTVEDVRECPLVLFAVGELDTVIGEYDMDVVWHGVA